MGIFDGIGSAQYFEGGKYIQPGLYLVEIQKVKQSFTRQKRPFFVVEMKVLETSNPKDHPVSTDMSWMVMLDQDAALGNIKHFISVASETPINEVQAVDAEEACSEGNPMAGLRLKASAVNILTKAKKDFTKVKFMPAETDNDEAMAEHEKETAAAAEAA